MNAVIDDIYMKNLVWQNELKKTRKSMEWSFLTGLLCG